jgi:hypothetical protein
MMMRSFIFFIFYFLFSPVGAQTMRDVIKQMPDSLLPYLKQNARLDFIDFIDSGMKAEVSNELGGKSQLTELTDDYASLTLNSASQVQLRLLDVNETIDDARQIICLVRTFGEGMRESTIDFYSVKWQPLPKEERISLPSYMHHIMLSSQAPELTIQRETGLDIPANEEQKEIDKTLITLKWNSKEFKMY